MSGLSELLERLRRLRPPPGAPARALGVPAAGEDVSGEVAVLFAELDALHARVAQTRAGADAGAAAAEAAARSERGRIVAEARAQAERSAERLLEERRAEVDGEVAAILAGAEREASRVRARGREASPALAAEVVRRIAAGSC